MRPIPALEDDALDAVRNFARARSLSLEQALSQLIRSGLERESAQLPDDAFPTFRVRPEARPLTPEDVRRSEEES